MSFSLQFGDICGVMNFLLNMPLELMFSWVCSSCMFSLAGITWIQKKQMYNVLLKLFLLSYDLVERMVCSVVGQLILQNLEGTLILAITVFYCGSGNCVLTIRSVCLNLDEITNSI